MISNITVTIMYTKIHTFREEEWSGVEEGRLRGGGNEEEKGRLTEGARKEERVVWTQWTNWALSEHESICYS